jgi:hypothetical protein
MTRGLIVLGAVSLIALAAGCRAGGHVYSGDDVARVTFRQRFAIGEKFVHFSSRTANLVDSVNDVTLETDLISEEREELWLIDDVDAAGLVTDLYVNTLSHNLRDFGDASESPGMYDKVTVKWDWIGKAYYGTVVVGTARDDIELAIDIPNLSPFGEHFLPRNPLGVGETEIRTDLWRMQRVLDELPKSGVSYIKPWTTSYLSDREKDEERYAILKVTATLGVPMPRDPVSIMQLEFTFDVVYDLNKHLLKTVTGRMVGHGEAKIPTPRGLQRIVTDVSADFVWRTDVAPEGVRVLPAVGDPATAEGGATPSPTPSPMPTPSPSPKPSSGLSASRR